MTCRYVDTIYEVRDTVITSKQQILVDRPFYCPMVLKSRSLSDARQRRNLVYIAKYLLLVISPWVWFHAVRLYIKRQCERGNNATIWYSSGVLLVEPGSPSVLYTGADICSLYVNLTIYQCSFGYDCRLPRGIRFIQRFHGMVGESLATIVLSFSHLRWGRRRCRLCGNLCCRRCNRRG